MWRWIWLIGWSVLIVGSGYQVIVGAERFVWLQWGLVACAFVLYSWTLRVWLSKRQDKAALYKGTFAPFAVAYLVPPIIYLPWWQWALTLFVVFCIYDAFVADGRFQDWLKQHDPASS